MKKILLFVLLFLPLFADAKLQGQARVDSLAGELSSDKYRNHNNADKLELLRLISYGYTFINPDEGLKYGSMELALAQALRINPGIANAYGDIGKQYYAKGLYPTALDYEFKGLKIADSMHILSVQSRLFVNIGKVYFRLKEYNTALGYLFSAAKLSREQGYQETLAEAFQGAGVVYQDIHKVDSAIAYDTAAYKIFNDLGDVEEAIQLKVNIGNVYGSQKNYKKAYDYFLSAIKENENIGNLMVFENSYGGLGLFTYKEAMDSIFDTKKSARSAKLLRSVDYFNKAVIYADQLKDAEDMMFNKARLAKSYMELHDYKQAVESITDYWWLKDSVLSNDNRVKIAALETQREADLKQKQMELNTVLEREKKKKRGLFGAVVFILVLVTGVVTRYYEKQKKTNTLLEQEKIKSNALLLQKDDLLGQKDILMKEIHHRVKNNLQVISALLDLQLEHVADEKARKALTEGMGRIRSIALIHQQLYKEDDIASLEFPRFAADLLKQVSAIFRKSGQHIRYDARMGETFLDIDTAIPLGLLLNELMTNSYKYAFPGGSDGSITIELSEKDQTFELTYTDSGPGLPPGYDIGKNSSLGMLVIGSLAKQLGGSFAYDYATKKFVVIFKGRDERKKTA